MRKKIINVKHYLLGQLGTCNLFEHHVMSNYNFPKSEFQNMLLSSGSDLLHEMSANLAAGDLMFTYIYHSTSRILPGLTDIYQILHMTTSHTK